MIIPRKKYPGCLLPHLQVVKGISVGSCRWEELGDNYKMDGERAHAHNRRNTCAGWLCLAAPDVLADDYALLHEVAHLHAPCQGHNDTWRRRLIEIGGSLDGTELDFQHGYPWGYHKELKKPLRVGMLRWMASDHHPNCPCGNRRLKPWGGQDPKVIEARYGKAL